jgi:hypothetical protein
MNTLSKTAVLDDLVARLAARRRLASQRRLARRRLAHARVSRYQSASRSATPRAPYRPAIAVAA